MKNTVMHSFLHKPRQRWNGISESYILHIIYKGSPIFIRVALLLLLLLFRYSAKS